MQPNKTQNVQCLISRLWNTWKPAFQIGPPLVNAVNHLPHHTLPALRDRCSGVVEQCLDGGLKTG